MKRKTKKIVDLIIQIAVLVGFTVLGGLFIPRSYLNHSLEIGIALTAIWGVAITLFTFIQGVVQNTKTNLIQTKKSKEYVLDKFNKIDSIIKHLAEDVRLILYVSLGYILLNLFFAQIQGNVWQGIMAYVQCFLFGLIALALYDLMQTMFKLVQINELLNQRVVDSREEGEKKDGK